MEHVIPYIIDGAQMVEIAFHTVLNRRLACGVIDSINETDCLFYPRAQEYSLGDFLRYARDVPE